MNEEFRSGSVAFQPRARLLKLIGAELISDEVVAITELVKNAHDADASTVTLEFRAVTGEKGEIVVSDDGRGMSVEALLRHWMEPAGTSKTGTTGRRTRTGRRVLGEKGVGRFAADKLGSKLELISRKRGEAEEVRALFDWDLFDSDSLMLSEIRNHWEARKATAIRSHGTTLRITGLRSAWTERMFRRLSTRLSRLRSPFGDQGGFAIRIESDEFPQYAGELRTEFLDRAPYNIEATFDGRQNVSVKMNGSRASDHVWNGGGDLGCGPVKVRIYSFDLETESVAKIGPRMEVRAWLKEWSGISVYRDGFRIWPYGEPHDDWLRLDQRRVNNPVVKLSNNQVVGFVEITGDGNGELKDQTNREGLLHNDAFVDLRRLLHFVLQLLEAERQSLRHPTIRGGGERTTPVEGAAAPVDAAFDKLASKVGPAVEEHVRRLEKSVRADVALRESMYRRQIEGYSELAGVGQVAIGVAKSLTPLLDKVREECGSLRRLLNGSGTRATASSIRAIESVLETVNGHLAMLSPIEGGSATQRRRAIDVIAELDLSKETLKPLLVERGVRMEIVRPTNDVVRAEMRPEYFHRLMHILAANSMDWLRSAKDPLIRVSAELTDDVCEIVFSDNGPGMSAAVAAVAFEPLFSGKEDGRGMGLAIAQSIVSLHGGTIEAIVDGRRRGATIRVALPRKRSRATVN
jgi:signal transduction histidine kinase